jgi:hypothetical protein
MGKKLPTPEGRMQKLTNGVAYAVAAAGRVVDFDADLHPWARNVLGTLRLVLSYTMRHVADDIGESGVAEALEIIRRDEKGDETEGGAE